MPAALREPPPPPPLPSLPRPGIRIEKLLLRRWPPRATEVAAEIGTLARGCGICAFEDWVTPCEKVDLRSASSHYKPVFTIQEC